MKLLPWASHAFFVSSAVCKC